MKNQIKPCQPYKWSREICWSPKVKEFLKNILMKNLRKYLAFIFMYFMLFFIISYELSSECNMPLYWSWIDKYLGWNGCVHGYTQTRDCVIPSCLLPATKRWRSRRLETLERGRGRGERIVNTLNQSELWPSSLSSSGRNQSNPGECLSTSLTLSAASVIGDYSQSDTMSGLIEICQS